MNVVTSWLAHRLERLYAVNGAAVASEVHQHMQEIFNSAKTTYDRLEPEVEGTLADDLARAVVALHTTLTSTAIAPSYAGRMARMETEHMIEGLRHFVGLLDPVAFEAAAGPSVVPVSTKKVVMDDSKVLTNNADRGTSTPVGPHPSTLPSYTPQVFTAGEYGTDDGEAKAAGLQPTMQPMQPEAESGPGQVAQVAEPAPSVAGTPPFILEIPAEEPPLANEPAVDNHTEEPAPHPEA